MQFNGDAEELVNVLWRQIGSDMFDISVRLRNCLSTANIVYIGDLIQKTEKELRKIPHLGRKSLDEAKDFLKEFGLELGIKIPNWRILPHRELLKTFLDQQSLKRLSLPPVLEPDKNTLIKLLRRVEELDLSIRSANCLNLLKIKYVGDLVLKTKSELMRKRNMGRKSVAEIEEKLAKMGLQLGLQVTGWPPNNIDNLLKNFSKKIEEERRRKAEKLHQDLRINNLEDELNYLAELARGERNRQIIIKYFGWDGQGPRTLEAVGKEFGMTRERVRQICNNFEESFKKANKKGNILTPNLDRSLKFVIDNLPDLADDLEQKLISRGITKTPFSLEGILTAANFLGRKARFRIVYLGGKRIIIKPGSAKIPKIIIRLAKKSIDRFGVTTISDVCGQTHEETNRIITKEFTTKILNLRKDLRWLDESGGWFWFYSPPKDRSRNRLLNLVQKILAVTGLIDISDLRAGVSRASRMYGFAPPRRVLLELCRQVPGVQVIGSMVKADPPLNWEEILKANEWGMVSILKEYGPVMQREDFEKKCLELGMKQTTFGLYLGHSSIITKFAKGIYGLRGSRIPPGLLETLKPIKSKVVKDYGWTDDGKIWLAHKLSKGMIKIGFFYVPAAMRQFLQGDFKIKATDGSLIENLKIKDSKGWSLTRYFERRGGEPGDYLLLIFDLTSHEVEARIGDESSLDDFRPVD